MRSKILIAMCWRHCKTLHFEVFTNATEKIKTVVFKDVVDFDEHFEGNFQDKQRFTCS